MQSEITGVLYVARASAVACLYAVALTGAGFGLANIVQRLGRATRIPPDLATAFSLGLGLYGGAWILLGVAGWLRPGPVLLILLPGLALGALQQLRVRSRWFVELGPAELIVLAPCLILLAVLFFAALRPPIGDPVAFYLAWPKVMAASGEIVPLPGYEELSAIWILVEAHFSVLLMFGGETAAKLFVWFGLIAALRAIWQLAVVCGCTVRGGLAAIAVLLTSTAVINVSFDGKTDIMAVAPALAATLWALRLGGRESGQSAMMVGLLVGTAIGAKFSYIPPLGTVIAVIFLGRTAFGSTHLHQRMRSLLVWSLAGCLTALIMVLPQLVKNGILFDAPLVPLNGEGPLVHDIWYTGATTRWILLTYPVALTFGNYWAQYGGLSPLVLGLLPFAFVWRPDRCAPEGARLLLVTVAAVAGLISWVIIAPSQFAPRYFLGPLLLLAVPAAWLAEQAWRSGGRLLQVAIPTVVVGLLLLLTYEVWAAASYGVRYAAARSVDGDGACLSEDYCELARRINDRVSPGSRLAYLSYYRYFLRPDILQCVVSPFALIPYQGSISGESVKALGIDYVLVDRANYPAKYQVDWSLLEPVFDYGANFSLYRVRPGQGAPSPTSCVEVAPGRWAVRPPSPPPSMSIKGN